MRCYDRLLKECEERLSIKTDFFDNNLKEIADLLDIVTKIKTIRTLELAIKVSDITLKKIKED